MIKSWFNYSVFLGLGCVFIAMKMMYTMVIVITAGHASWKKVAAAAFTIILVSVIGWVFIRIGLDKSRNDDVD